MPINMYDPTRDYKSHKDEYNNSINEVLNKGNFINGQQVKDIESKLCEYVDSTNCICVGNGTDALQIALMAVDIEHGDEVITVPYTWISTAEVITLLGAKPVFIDINKDTFCMDESLIEDAITKKTKAIMPVSLYGSMPNYDKINEIANKYGIPVIEDAAQSFGSTVNDKKSCNLTTIGCTSFFPTKPLGCYGDGGAIFTNDKELADKIRSIKNHGALKRFHHNYIGVNSRLDTIQAAVLNIKLKYFDTSLINRQHVAKTYCDKLCHLKDIKLPKIQKNSTSAWAQFTITLPNNINRDEMVKQLKENGINVAIFYPMVLHQQECFKYLNCDDSSFPVSIYISEHVINLPCYGELTNDEIDTITTVFIDVYNKLL
jgi:UDP-2-acetamido-2-deoxy-ribo-hexuluronate aminotransferase